MDFKAIGIMGIIIAALFGTTIWQARELGEKKAEIRAHEVANEWRVKLENRQEIHKTELEKLNIQNNIELQEAVNEREAYQTELENISYTDTVTSSDYIAGQLAGIMRDISSANNDNSKTIQSTKTTSPDGNEKSQ